MRFDAKFNATDQSFTPSFGEVCNISDGGFERGYDAGYAKGNTEGQEVGYTKGHAEGYTEGETVGYEAGYADGKIPVVEKDVNFYNYDGRLLHSYTLEEIQALTELPPAPQMGRDFLSFEEWNWSLEDIKALNLPLSVMATVCPTDGNTKAVLEVIDARFATVTMHLIQRSGALIVDWGDGSEPATFAAVASNTTRTLTHTYASAGEYVVTVASEGEVILGHGAAARVFIGGSGALSSTAGFLTEVYVGKNTLLTNYCFGYGGTIRIASFSVGVADIPQNAFVQQHSICAVSLPRTVKSLSSTVFSYVTVSLSCFSIPMSVNTISYCAVENVKTKTVTIPPYVADTGTRYSSFQNVYLAEGITKIASGFSNSGVMNGVFEIPSTVQTIGAQALYGQAYLKKLVFRPLVPPTVENANAFHAFPSGCIVEVPAESLELYQNATNYGTIAAQMVGV